MRGTARFVRPLAAGAAAALVIPAAIAFSPGASAATIDTGDANSTGTVLSLTALGHTAQAVKAQLSASTIKNPSSALVDLVPVTLDGTSHFEQTVSSGSQSVASKSIAAPANAVSVTTPALALTANTTNGPVAALTTNSGTFSQSLLGLVMPSFTASLNFGSSVVNKTSDAAKTVDIKGFTLPTLSDLLGALGVDLTQVDITHLMNLVDQLDLNTSSAIQTAEATFNTAKAAVTTATAQVAAATTALNSALAAAPFSDSSIVTLLGTLGLSTPTTAAQWQAISGADQTAIVAALNLITAGTGTAIDTANTALTTAQATLATALAALTAATAALIPLLVAALDTPLASIGELTVGTVAQAGGKHVAQVTGTVKGVTVLGNQLVNSTDVVSLVSSTLATVTNEINALTQTVSSTLTGALLNGLVGTLTVPAPKISLLQKTTSLSPSDGYQAATADVVGAAVSWGALTIPTAASPLVTDPLDVTVADLSEASRFAPTPTTPTSSSPSGTPTSGGAPGLATTGVPAGVAVGALLLMLAAYGVRRLRSTGDGIE
jgi:hypothetical protein